MKDKNNLIYSQSHVDFYPGYSCPLKQARAGFHVFQTSSATVGRDLVPLMPLPAFSFFFFGKEEYCKEKDVIIFNIFFCIYISKTLVMVVTQGDFDLFRPFDVNNRYGSSFNEVCLLLMKKQANKRSS